jgi:hypothetical protein
VCTYATETITALDSSGKTPAGWVPLTHASVYYDHPVHAPAEHTVNIDFLSRPGGPSARVAVELSLQTAADLVAALQQTLARAGALGLVPPG